MVKIFKRTVLIGLILLMLVVGFVGASYYYFLQTVYPVLPGQVYRTAQPTPERLAAVIQQYHIKAILNLRGNKVKDKWYQQEIAVTHRLRVAHASVGLHSYRLPSIQSLRKLTALLMALPRPLLIHCQGGVDRTGLAAEISLILNNAPLTRVLQQVSLKYFAIYPHSVGRLVMPYYMNWLHLHHLKSSRKHFLIWLRALRSFQLSANPLRLNIFG